MKTPPFIVAILALVALAACDKPKVRHVQPDPMAAQMVETADIPAATGAGMSLGLAKRPEFPGFYLDHIGAALDPMNRKPAVTAAEDPILLDGFGFDPITKTPAKGVDVVIDGKAWPTTYGSPRGDVASFNKVPGLIAVGFATTLPPKTLMPGAHSAVVRVVAADGRGFFEGPAVAFTVK